MILVTLSKEVIFKIIISLSVEKRRNRCLERGKLRLKEAKLFHKNAQHSGRGTREPHLLVPCTTPDSSSVGSQGPTLGRVLRLSLKAAVEKTGAKRTL